MYTHTSMDLGIHAVCVSHVCVCVSVCLCVCACVRERKRETEEVCVCVCVSVCESVGEGAGKRRWGCLLVHIYTCICVEQQFCQVLACIHEGVHAVVIRACCFRHTHKLTHTHAHAHLHTYTPLAFSLSHTLRTFTPAHTHVIRTLRNGHGVTSNSKKPGALIRSSPHTNSGNSNCSTRFGRCNRQFLEQGNAQWLGGCT